MATTFLQLSQDHLKQPGMKLFPNYTPPIPPHHNNTNSNSSSSAATATTTASGNFSTMSNNVNNHHYHQITYQTQTLAPLRLNQDHFSGSKTNTLGGVGGPNGLPNGRPKYQTHHHHHHHHEQQQHPSPHHHHQLHPLSPDHHDELDVDGCSASISAASGCDNEDDSNSATTSPPHSPSSPVPPELPIRNGLVVANYNVNTLNHSIVANGSGKMGPPRLASVDATGTRKTVRHYH
ncbi:protein bunched, class 2/F/G isoform-like [Armigeres subalbatus]|uniref:protein bunched, class 2/F/G isoform-like n=1 Tax=Armigeres subalbatus TaxID=124917 RepID=UPI002ED5A291